MYQYCKSTPQPANTFHSTSAHLRTVKIACNLVPQILRIVSWPLQQHLESPYRSDMPELAMGLVGICHKVSPRTHRIASARMQTPKNSSFAVVHTQPESTGKSHMQARCPRTCCTLAEATSTLDCIVRGAASLLPPSPSLLSSMATRAPAQHRQLQ